MEDIYTSMLEYANELKKRTGQLEKLVMKCPEGNLYNKTVGDRNYYFIRSMQKGVLSNKYLPLSEAALLRKYADKRYAGYILPRMKENLSAAEAFLKHHCGMDEYQLSQKFNPQILKLCGPAVRERERFIENWQNEEYHGTPSYHDSELILPTARGEFVRSKSEVFIANALYAAGLPYHYEKPFHLEPDEQPVFPDFTILDPITLLIFYWEHFGMMDDPEYAVKALKKLLRLHQNGIIPGKNLICTFEARAVPLSTLTITNTIKAFFNV